MRLVLHLPILVHTVTEHSQIEHNDVKFCCRPYYMDIIYGKNITNLETSVFVSNNNFVKISINFSSL